MENVLKCEVADEASGEQNSMLLLESPSVNSEMEITNTESDLCTVDVETNNQQSVEISPDLEEVEGKPQFLFAPFDHSMRPDPELVRLELERSADQEAITKIIKDRYKLIMEVSARRKEKEQRDKMKYSQISCNMANENVLKTTQLTHYVDNEDIEDTTQLLHNMRVANENVLENTQLSRCVDSEDIKETTQLLHNMHVAHENVSKSSQLPHDMHPTPSSLTEDQSEECFESHLEKVFWHNGLRRFIKLNYSEINTTANISSIGMLNTVTQHHGHRVGEALNQVRNDQEEGLKRITFLQSSGKLGSAKRKKTTHVFQEEFIGAPSEEFPDDTSGSP